MSILHYTEAGQGEALILLHSGGMSGKGLQAPETLRYAALIPAYGNSS